MTQEDKQLLLKDLCARLPYGVKVLYWHPKSGGAERRIGELVNVDLRLNCHQLLFRVDEYYFESDNVDTSKPYLRPMSSMTEEEHEEYDSRRKHICDEYNRYCFDSVESLDWLNEHHFDYRGLIPMGLAIEALDDMYKTE